MVEPPHDPDAGCKLLDGFAIVIQVLLASTALGTLVVKRARERPQRPVNIWLLDVGKQFSGAIVIHSLNLLVSYSRGRPHHGGSSNLCVWYFLNVGVDTTLGVGILWVILRSLQWSLQRIGVTGIRTGDYGTPPSILSWIKQTIIFIISLSGMKLCVYGLFRLCPWLFDFGKWVLGWTRDNYRTQVVFVMLIFPLCMNAFQIWVIDTIVKNKLFKQEEPENVNERTRLLAESNTNTTE
ncbi:vacuolar membrane protein-domain-containing protein [Umbelopsis sp. PMI_123]|nr:vacuolar membrane protein-domain-containing protein [Umbelopsis sp. PMI_123]